MNELIKQLADEAGIQFYNLSTDDTNNPQMCGSIGVLEWFAELIVRECANHCDLLLDHKISSEWSRGTHDCSRAIKKHFGVTK